MQKARESKQRDEFGVGGGAHSATQQNLEKRLSHTQSQDRAHSAIWI